MYQAVKLISYQNVKLSNQIFTLIVSDCPTVPLSDRHYDCAPTKGCCSLQAAFPKHLFKIPTVTLSHCHDITLSFCHTVTLSHRHTVTILFSGVVHSTKAVPTLV